MSGSAISFTMPVCLHLCCLCSQCHEHRIICSVALCHLLYNIISVPSTCVVFIVHLCFGCRGSFPWLNLCCAIMVAADCSSSLWTHPFAISPTILFVFVVCEVSADCNCHQFERLHLSPSSSALQTEHIPIS